MSDRLLAFAVMDSIERMTGTTPSRTNWGAVIAWTAVIVTVLGLVALGSMK